MSIELRLFLLRGWGLSDKYSSKTIQDILSIHLCHYYGGSYTVSIVNMTLTDLILMAVVSELHGYASMMSLFPF